MLEWYTAPRSIFPSGNHRAVPAEPRPGLRRRCAFRPPAGSRLLGIGFLVLAGWALLAPGCARDGEPVLTEHPGYPAYRKYCRRCHGNRGDGAKASRMAKRPVSLIAPAYRDTVDLEQVLDLVRDGRGRMKGYREKLSTRELEAVSRYALEMPPRRPEP